MAESCEGSNCRVPDRDVRIVRDLIYYQSAKIIARSTLQEPDGRPSKDFTGSHLNGDELCNVRNNVPKVCPRSLYNLGAYTLGASNE